MCRPVTCKICGKTTWAGCGQHIASVKAQVSAEQWCDGQHPENPAQTKRSGSIFAKLFGR